MGHSLRTKRYWISCLRLGRCSIRSTGYPSKQLAQEPNSFSLELKVSFQRWCWCLFLRSESSRKLTKPGKFSTAGRFRIKFLPSNKYYMLTIIVGIRWKQCGKLGYFGCLERNMGLEFSRSCCYRGHFTSWWTKMLIIIIYIYI